jgi:hypothetical protein
MPDSSSASKVDELEERMAAARRRQIERAAALTGDKAIPSVQRAPDTEDYSRVEDIQERVRKARAGSAESVEGSGGGEHSPQESSSMPLVSVQRTPSPGRSTQRSQGETQDAAPSTEQLQRAVDPASTSRVDVLEERIRQARQRQIDAGWTPREVAQPESPPPAAQPSMPSSLPASFVQRVAEIKGNLEQPAEPLPEVTSEAAPFRPINRYRDPRVLARSIEPSQPLLQSDLPLSRSQPPQSRSTVSSMPLAAVKVQRSFDDEQVYAENDYAEGLSNIFGEASAASVEVAAGGTSTWDHGRVQRSPEPRQELAARAQRKQANTASTRASSKPSPSARSITSDPRMSATHTGTTRTQESSVRPAPSVQRAPLTLAKSRTATGKDVVQRDKETDEVGEKFVGVTEGSSPRSTTQPEMLKGARATSKNPCEDCDDDDGKKLEKDLDRLARAILPVVKRMMAIERDRRNPRSAY